MRQAWPILPLFFDTISYMGFERYCELMIGFDDWYFWLVLMTDTFDWFWWLILLTGFDNWYFWLVLVTDTSNWFWWLILLTGFDDWYFWLVLMTGTFDWLLCLPIDRFVPKNETGSFCTYQYFIHDQSYRIVTSHVA